MIPLRLLIAVLSDTIPQKDNLQDISEVFSLGFKLKQHRKLSPTENAKSYLKKSLTQGFKAQFWSLNGSGKPTQVI